MNWINVGFTNEHIEYVVRKFLDNLIEEEKLFNTRKLVAEKQHADTVRDMWSGGKNKGLGCDMAIGNHDDIEKGLRKSMKTQKRGKNGRFISTKRKRRI